MGQIHFYCAVSALLLGPWILWRPKGTQSHRWLGRLWVGLMLVSNLTALSLVTVHGLTLFTLLALYSLVSVLAAFVLVWRKPIPHWRVWHYYLMSYGYLGVLAAALARLPVMMGSAFWPGVLGTMVVVFGVGGWWTERVARERVIPARRSSGEKA
ncbi:DUF2306 domain-containing protein [Ferrimonas balearica]|uniref:DUF2306 domain-containing protein n=1 Tax=Ferrimonas balearica TaxID=44012 RepID=UPI001C98EA98|nr:DUF2306 domain-containing protein [Ferrimonas balearica]MBY5991306.1 DUF2306 domain-containing protein [Ferrimonas balearica]